MTDAQNENPAAEGDGSGAGIKELTGSGSGSRNNAIALNKQQGDVESWGWDFDSSRQYAEREREALREQDGKWVGAYDPAIHPQPHFLQHGRDPCASKTWAYENARGEIETYRKRVNGERRGSKSFSTWSLWQREGEEPQWRGAFPPKGSCLLYNTRELGERPHAPVVVVEGEKTCDATKRIFPEAVCVTSMGGSRLAALSNWGSVIGRAVLIVPDNDIEGARYARDVASLAHEAGAKSIEIVDTETVASIDPKGGSRLAMAGWDLADAVEPDYSKSGQSVAPPNVWTDLKLLRETLMTYAKPWYATYLPARGFSMSLKYPLRGLQHQTKKIVKGDDGTMKTVVEPHYVCQPFEVVSEVNSASQADACLELRFRIADGPEHTILVRKTAIATEPAKLVGPLLARDFKIERTKYRDFAEYLNLVKPKQRKILVYRTGWQNARDWSRTFVTPQGSYCNSRVGNDLEYRLDPAMETRISRAGTLAQWQRSIGELSAQHVTLALSVLLALSGALFPLMGVTDIGGIHFVGPSSIGKTSLAAGAASVWGFGGDSAEGLTSILSSWHATETAVEILAAACSGAILITDEINRATPQTVFDVVYAVANGQGKNRATVDIALRSLLSWQMPWLSTGEVTTAEKIGEDRSLKVKAGQLARLRNIYVDREFGFGVFDSAPENGGSVDLVNRIKRAAVTHYGTAGPAFAAWLAENFTGELDAEIRRIVADFRRENLKQGADYQVGRAADFFGMLKATGVLALRAGILSARPDRDCVGKAAEWGLSAWINQRGGVESHETTSAVEMVSSRIMANLTGKFAAFDKEEREKARPLDKIWGYKREVTGQVTGLESLELYVNNTGMSELCKDMNEKYVLDTLIKKGHLLKAKDGIKINQRIPGIPECPRWYVLVGSIFGDKLTKKLLQELREEERRQRLNKEPIENSTPSTEEEDAEYLDTMEGRSED